MFAGEFERQVIRDSRSQDRKTAAAVIIGAALAVGAGTLIVRSPDPWLAAIGVVVLLSAVGTKVYFNLRDKRHGFAAEVFGYFMTVLTLPAVLVLLPAAGQSLMLLCATYQEAGRYKIASRLIDLATFLFAYNPTIPPSIKLGYKCGRMELLYVTGQYAQAIKEAREIISQAENNYKLAPTNDNLEALALLQSQAIIILYETGHQDEARQSWTRIKGIERFNNDSKPHNLAYVYNSIAQCSNILGDYQFTLDCIESARENYDKGSFKSTLLRAAFHMAAAEANARLERYLPAEKEATSAKQEYSSFLQPTDAAFSGVYAVLARCAAHNGDLDKAKDLYEKAASIRRVRYGFMHPGLGRILEGYIEVLRALNTDDATIHIYERELAEIRAHHMPSEQMSCEPAPTREQPATQSNDTLASLAAGKSAVSGLPAFVVLFLIGYAIGKQIGLGIPGLIGAMLSICGANAATNMVRNLRAKSLTKQLQNAVPSNVLMRFSKKGKLFPEFSAIAETGSDLIPPYSNLFLSLAGNMNPAVFTGEAISATVFTTPRVHKPVIVVAKNESFMVDNNFLNAVPRELRCCFRGALSTFVVIAMLQCCAMFEMPPDKVPGNKTAQEYYDLGVQYKGFGWTEKSRESLKRAIELDKGGSIAQRAQDFMDTRLPKHPQPEEAIQMNIQAYNLQESNPAEAERIWQSCIEKYPDFEWPYSNLGSMLADQGKYDEGEKLLRKAIEINPKYVNAWIHLGESKQAQCEKAAARDCYRKALDLDPDDPIAKMKYRFTSL